IGAAELSRERADGWKAAVTAFDRALEGFREISDRAGEMKTLIERGRAFHHLANPDALSTVEQAGRLAAELRDEAAQARALRLLGAMLNARGEVATALAKYEAATAISRALGDSASEAASLTGEALAYRRRGDAEGALARFERALSLAQALRDTWLEAGLLNNIGLVYKDLGEYDKALEMYERSVANRRAAGDRRGLFPALANLGSLYGLTGDPARALELHTEALALAREVGSPSQQSAALDLAGQTLEKLGEPAKALEHYRESLELRIAAGDRRGEASSMAGVGRALHALGRSDEGVELLHRALDLTRRLNLRFRERDVLHQLARIERDRGHADEALNHIRAAVDLDEMLRARITTPELRASFVASEGALYEQLIDLLQTRHLEDPAGPHLAEALHVSERARARVLLDSLLEGRVELRRDVDPALLERERALQRELSDASAALSTAVAAGAGGDRATEAAARVDRAAAAYQELQAQIRRRSPRYAAVTRPEPLTAAEIQKHAVDERTVLLEFALGEERSWLWAVTPDAIATAELPPRAAIERTLRSLYEAITARQRLPDESADAYDRRVREADARLLHARAEAGRMLLGPIAPRLNGDWRGKRLAVVTTGALEYLPFAAVAVPADSASAAGSTDDSTPTDAPLLARHEIVHIPSASVLAALRQEARVSEPAPRAVAVIADPVFELADPRVRRATEHRTASEQLAGNRLSLYATRLAERGRLGRLPFSREEAASIAALVPDGDLFSAMDFEASRATVLNGALTGHRIVHLATHGVFDAASPGFSGLVLSLVNERGEPQDGFLRLDDIYNMRLDADLVVLSACQTALGREIRGEGLVGLARAFMYAGAPRVIASLWQVSDFATAELMKRFYRGVLTEGLPPAAALRAAQLEMSRDRRWAAPYYWAGFVLQGDWK
ncbi:MAG TPA: CHAT domain-containing tetratricopeptide repeat protein, partial [Vicinamibacterales bacterium]|nr:CHAT domain-containing tetratricopeptide repeat protein [Vicinamibacterales bacterium]